MASTAHIGMRRPYRIVQTFPPPPGLDPAVGKASIPVLFLRAPRLCASRPTFLGWTLERRGR